MLRKHLCEACIDRSCVHLHGPHTCGLLSVTDLGSQTHTVISTDEDDSYFLQAPDLCLEANVGSGMHSHHLPESFAQSPEQDFPHSGWESIDATWSRGF